MVSAGQAETTPVYAPGAASPVVVYRSSTAVRSLDSVTVAGAESQAASLRSE
jgi:hypothetical protein